MYDKSFYSVQAVGSLSSARVVVPHIMERFSPKSVCDVGCGVGTWLQAFTENGCVDVTGFDGEYVDVNMLCIDKEKFNSVNIEQANYPVNRKYDVCVSLEVAEHLSSNRAESFVDWLCSLSDIVIFSAAVPGQDGTYHINEQWQSYWVKQFNRNGFIPVDAIRPLIWDSQEVCWWYKQNTLVYVKDQNVSDRIDFVVDILHPDFLRQKLETPDSFSYHLQVLLPYFYRAVRRRWLRSV